MDKISEHVSYNEATVSPTALRLKIDNTPDAETLERMKVVAAACFEPLRKWYGKPIRVNSFYRNKALNKAVKGSSSSQHILGEAIDLSAGSKEENKKLHDWIASNLVFDQLINEYDYTWVHVSFRLGNNRNEKRIIK
jgi:zinc D-Ala-D-Ala carboxypeptidase